MLILELLTDFFGLLYPKVCAACNDLLKKHENCLCLSCRFSFPKSHFTSLTDNAIHQLFWGRFPLQQAFSMYKFQKSGVLQTLMHQLKYGGQQEVGLYFGKELGKALFEQKGFVLPDLIVPVPLHWKKEKTRGYNQCQLICEGLSNKLNIPIVSNILYRKVHSESQTKKKRFQRWENVEEIFGLNESSVLIGKHILLIDDIVTTGSTLEACVQTLLQIEGTSISIATIAYA